MSVVNLSNKARADLREIHRYSLRQWGEAQAERYLTRFHKAFWMLSANPRIALPCPDIQPGYRKYTVGSHVVFLREIETGIEIVRVLHQSMDLKRHLGDSE